MARMLNHEPPHDRVLVDVGQGLREAVLFEPGSRDHGQGKGTPPPAGWRANEIPTPA